MKKKIEKCIFYLFVGIILLLNLVDTKTTNGGMAKIYFDESKETTSELGFVKSEPEITKDEAVMDKVQEINELKKINVDEVDGIKTAIPNEKSFKTSKTKEEEETPIKHKINSPNGNIVQPVNNKDNTNNGIFPKLEINSNRNTSPNTSPNSPVNDTIKADNTTNASSSTTNTSSSTTNTTTATTTNNNNNNNDKTNSKPIDDALTTDKEKTLFQSHQNDSNILEVNGNGIAKSTDTLMKPIINNGIIKNVTNIPDLTNEQIKSKESPASGNVSDQPNDPKIDKTKKYDEIGGENVFEVGEDGYEIPPLKINDDVNTNDNDFYQREGEDDVDPSDEFSNSESGYSHQAHSNGREEKPRRTENVKTKVKETLGKSPDVEDSNFYVYFLTVVIMAILFYLVFHNKQKIIALTIEGRDSRRRRAASGGRTKYHKLDSNLEEAMAFNPSMKYQQNVLY